VKKLLRWKRAGVLAFAAYKGVAWRIEKFAGRPVLYVLWRGEEQIGAYVSLGQAQEAAEAQAQALV
jgi:hypothetical protein